MRKKRLIPDIFLKTRYSPRTSLADIKKNFPTISRATLYRMHKRLKLLHKPGVELPPVGACGKPKKFDREKQGKFENLILTERNRLVADWLKAQSHLSPCSHPKTAKPLVPFAAVKEIATGLGIECHSRTLRRQLQELELCDAVENRNRTRKNLRAKRRAADAPVAGESSL